MFRNAYRLPFKLLGIPIYIDITFLIVLPLFAYLIGSQIGVWARMVGVEDHPSLHGALAQFLLGLAGAAGLFVSILVHELGHSATARAYGVQTRRITLWLLGGIAQLEDMPRQRGAEAVVAIVGPVVSVAVAGVCWLAGALIPPAALPARFVLFYLFQLNLMLAAFNMLPALPLDGGRVLRSLLALRTPHLRATQIAARVSKVLAIAMCLAGFWWGAISLVLIAFFVYMAANSELRDSQVADMLDGVRVSDLMHRDVETVPPDLTIDELARMMIRRHQQGFVVVDPATGRVVGMVALEDLQGGGGGGGAGPPVPAGPLPPEATVGQIMSPVCVIGQEAPALDALQRMSRAGCSRLAVVDALGNMVGVITRMDLMRAIELRTITLNWGPPSDDGRQVVPRWTTPPPLPEEGDGRRREEGLRV